MGGFLDQLARSLGKRGQSRRQFLKRSGGVAAGMAIASAGAVSVGSGKAEATCPGCAGCYTTHGTSGTVTIIGTPLNFRTGPSTDCIVLGQTTVCPNYVSRSLYTDDGDYVCNCCGHCSSRWYYNSDLPGWFASVWTEQNDGGCGSCCDALRDSDVAVG